MSGGKETPRQKMIGMMYLVLTALLALNVSSAVLEKFAILNTTLIDLINENTATNELQNQKVALTGGYSLVGIAGLEISWNRVQVGFNIQGPFSQNFADGQTTLKNRGMAHITYVF